jgi:hypothetical protein
MHAYRFMGTSIQSHDSERWFVGKTYFQTVPREDHETAQQTKLDPNHDEYISQWGLSFFFKGTTKDGIDNKDQCQLLRLFEMFLVFLVEGDDGGTPLLQHLTNDDGGNDSECQFVKYFPQADIASHS